MAASLQKFSVAETGWKPGKVGMPGIGSQRAGLLRRFRQKKQERAVQKPGLQGRPGRKKETSGRTKEKPGEKERPGGGTKREPGQKEPPKCGTKGKQRQKKRPKSGTKEKPGEKA